MWNLRLPGMGGSIQGMSGGIQGGGVGMQGSGVQGHFGSGAQQIDQSTGGMNTQFGTEWNNNELAGMTGGGIGGGMTSVGF